MDYLLDRNALGQSYITCHFAHGLDPAIPSPPLGALAGGPTNQTYPDFPDDPRLPDLPPQRANFDVPT